MSPCGTLRPARRRLVAIALLLGVTLGWASCGGSGPLREEPLRAVEAPLTTDRHLALARQYAPWIYHEVHPTRGRQDLPTRVDFDGDLRGGNNWDAMARHPLPPVVYYAALETGTHWFLSYHLFHPRDWSWLRVGFNETHENDGENLQVVVEKASGRPVLLFTQAHYFGAAHGDAAAFPPGEEELTAPLLRLDAAGRPSREGAHAGVYVEAMGHGIYGALDEDVGLTVAPDGRARLASGAPLLVLRPAREGEAVEEPALPPGEAAVPYALESITAKLWPGVRDGTLIGEGGLLDGCVELARGPLVVQVPRFYEGDRFSGVFGSDRGIAPFALCFSFLSDDPGDLFFDPAGTWAQALKVPEPWSRRYVDYPFGAAPE